MSQRWQHGTSTPVTHSYGYDSVQRLVSWIDGTDTPKYVYDAVGNRLQAVKNSGTSRTTYGYAGAVPNQMTQSAPLVSGTELSHTYGYDPNGAVTGIRNWNLASGTVSTDSLVYSYRGLTEGFLHREYNGASVTATSEWRYRYSASGDREQKRVYLQQDANHNVIQHNSWVYYLLGGNAKQLAVYHGQEMAVPGCLPPGPVSVYFYPVEFLTYGTGTTPNLVTIPDISSSSGVKEFHIADHLGSTRVTINTSTGSQYADYGPSGNLLAGGADILQGFTGMQLDKESHTLHCGARQKEESEVRFRRPDAFWEKYRSLSVYQYAACNPMRYRDPSGNVIDICEDAANDLDPATTLVAQTEAESLIQYEPQNKDVALRVASDDRHVFISFGEPGKLGGEALSAVTKPILDRDGNVIGAQIIVDKDRFDKLPTNADRVGLMAHELFHVAELFSKNGKDLLQKNKQEVHGGKAYRERSMEKRAYSYQAWFESAFLKVGQFKISTVDPVGWQINYVDCSKPPMQETPAQP